MEPQEEDKEVEKNELDEKKKKEDEAEPREAKKSKDQKKGSHELRTRSFTTETLFSPLSASLSSTTTLPINK